MPRNIWITRAVKDRDLAGVHVFGKVRVIYDGPHLVAPHDIKRQEDLISREVIPEARPDDLILTAGPMIMMCVLVTAFVREFGGAKFLVYERISNGYVIKYTGYCST